MFSGSSCSRNCRIGGGGGGRGWWSKSDWRFSRLLLTFYMLQLTIPRELKCPWREGESTYLGAVEVGVGVWCGVSNTYS